MEVWMSQPRAQAVWLLLGVVVVVPALAMADTERGARAFRRRVRGIENAVNSVEALGRDARNHPQRAGVLLRQARTRVARTVGPLRKLGEAARAEGRLRGQVKEVAKRVGRAKRWLRHVERLLGDLSTASKQVQALGELMSAGEVPTVGSHLKFPRVDAHLNELAGAIFRAAGNPLVKGQLYRERGVQGIRRMLAGELNSSIGWRVEELACAAAITGISVEAVVGQSGGWNAHGSAEGFGARRVRSLVSQGEFALGLAEHVMGSLALMGVALGQVAGVVERAKRRLREGQRRLGQSRRGSQLLYLYQ